MKSFFTLLTRLSLRFRAVTLALMVVVSVLGLIAVTQLKQELLPSIEFPQTVILTQVSGMSSDQVLNVLTKRLETALEGVEQIVNTESTTTGAFGSVLIARNNFGENQVRLTNEIRQALDAVWLPLRRIEPPADANAQEFAQSLLADLTPEMLIYVESKDANFLFQLTPEVWASLSDDTVKGVLAYLAAQTEETVSDKGALRQLIDQEIVPQLETLDVVANIQVSGGQALPGEETVSVPVSESSTAESTSLLLQLSPDVWAIASAKAGYEGALDGAAVEALKANAVEAPAAPPTLPDSWIRDHFNDTSDLLEMKTLTQTVAAVFNNFYEDGQIVGALGQTDDLTAEDITQMLAIEPTLVQYFKAEHLAALSPEAFAALPTDFIAGLDGFTRDELAAAQLAQSITGQEAQPEPVDLPSAWRISPPQLISFSFDDLPLASFSIYSTGETVSEAATSTETTETEPVAEITATPEPAAEAAAVREIPEGPALPPFFRLLGTQFGIDADTADDLIDIQLPDDVAEQFGGSTLRAADLLNFIVLLSNPENLPPGTPSSPIPIDPNVIIGALGADVVAFLVENDPSFLPNLQPGTFDYFNDDVLALPQIAPPLADAWNTLAGRPQFTESPLNTAADVLALGDGKASSVLNAINATVPADFAGYEVRLFDSLSVGTMRYFALQETGFYGSLDADVLKKLSPTVLALLPDDVLDGLDETDADTLRAIADGTQESAAQELAALYSTDTPEADPDAPALNPEWATIGNFLGVELNTADDFFRFLQQPPADFINSLLDSPQGAAFAPGLLGNISAEAMSYLAENDANFLTDLRPEALQLLSADVLGTLPQDTQDRALSGGEAFKPTASVTRTNGNNSLLVTIYKTDGANTVEAFHRVEEALNEIDERDESIGTSVGFEQASFIQESIDGVAREGGLGGVFAIIIILIFLSAGVWARSGRRTTGLILFVLFLALLVAVIASGLGAAGGDVGLAFAQADVIVRILLILGAIFGLVIWLWPGELPYPAWRSTLVVGVSIPLSLLMAMALMRWLPPTVNQALAPAAENSDLLGFILRLFPASLTINIMTLSGFTVAIGRVVDDSIVVLENIFRQIQEGGDKKTAIITGTRDVSVAIFAATVITVVVFLPLGLTGGIISEFFLPFGLAVTYALLSSFLVAITVVPVMAYLFIGTEEAVEEAHEGALERLYVPTLKWALSGPLSKGAVLLLAFISFVIGMALFASRPTTFLPGLGEPQISVSVNLPGSTKIVETNTKVLELESWVRENNSDGDLGTVQTTIGSGGASLESLIGAGSGVSENIASITIGVESQNELDSWAGRIRTEAERIFGADNVTVSAASLSDQGFGGFELVLSGPEADLQTANQMVIDTLNSIPGITNATSDLAAVGAGSEGAPQTYIRIDGQSAVSFAAELETENTLGVTAQAIEKIKALPDLPDTISISQGFNSDLQTQGFQSLFTAMGIAIVIVIIILMVTFGSVVHWFDIILSIMVAPVGAAVFLTITDRVLGISAMIGLLMLIGIVVTNAVVLIDRVQANLRERKMSTYDALVEAGGRRLRPILMTALATVFALVPLAIGLSKGAIIAAELGTVVIGGLVSSTLLTLIVVPVMYSLLAPLHKRIAGLFGRSGQ
ncbi:MAG: efflux RND transporter permease subunit [Anaerolineae bacterium]|nr:efflux RND transporter permease subunit [Anaerolineae bacterium]